MSVSTEDILSDKELPELEEKPEAKAAEPKPAEPKPVVAESQGAKPNEPAAPPAVVPDSTEKHIPLKALEEERKKRQELERRLKEIEAAKTQPERQEPEFWSDPQAFISQSLTQVRVETSQATMRALHKDYDEMEAFFVEQAQSRYPYLAAQVASHPNPALFVYQTAQRLKELDEVEKIGGISKLREQVAAEAEAKVRAEYEAKLKPAVPNAPPQSLAAVANTPNPVDVFTPPSTEDVFGRSRKRA